MTSNQITPRPQSYLATWGPIILLLIGIGLGGVGGWIIGQPTKPDSSAETPKVESTVPTGWRSMQLPIAGTSETLSLTIRETDQVARLVDGETEIGYKVVDSFAPKTGAAIDVILKRRVEYYELPDATSLDAYKEPQDGLTVQDSREVTIRGHRLLKQLYTAKIGQKQANGSIITKPIGNLMRYIIEGADGQIVILATSATFQTYLDKVAQSIDFGATGSNQSNENIIDLGGDASDADLTPTNENVLFQSTGGTEL